MSASIPVRLILPGLGYGRLARHTSSPDRGTQLLSREDQPQLRRDFRNIVQNVVTRWHEVIGDMTLGDAILDRVVHRAHRLELKGASLRKRQSASAAASLTDAVAG